MKVILTCILFSVSAAVAAGAAQDVSTRAEQARVLLDDAAAALKGAGCSA